MVDDEYIVSISKPEVTDFCYYTAEGIKMAFGPHSPPPSRFDRKIFFRVFQYFMNPNYIGTTSTSPITSIAALVGENTSGKSSILECLYTRADQSNYRNEEQRYFLLVFLDKESNSIVVRTRDIWLEGEESKKKDIRETAGYEEYIFPLAVARPAFNKDITHLFSFSLSKDIGNYSGYSVMGLPTISGDLDSFGLRNSFKGAFDIFCEFKEFGGAENKLVFFLQDKDKRRNPDYFTEDKINAKQYKSFFIHKLAQVLFDSLRDYLYHPDVEYTMDGTPHPNIYEEAFIKEDEECSKVLSFSNISYHKYNVFSFIRESDEMKIPVENIRKALNFFKTSTFIHMGKVVYDRYIQHLEQLFDLLFELDSELFTAFYKLEIPFDTQYAKLVDVFQSCLDEDDLDGNWTESVQINVEWLSAGEFHIAMLFSAIYQRFTERYAGIDRRNVILLIDEPEMHMHPEVGRSFIDKLETALGLFKKRSLINSCQLIFATHSPFIIQSLSSYNNFLSLVKKVRNQIQIQQFDNIPQLRLPGRQEYSFNLVMYKVFNVPTVELHNELFGVLQEITGCLTINDYKDKETKKKVFGIESWFFLNGLKKTHKWTEKNKDGTYKEPLDVTLQTYIRNSIHHPENRANKKYTPDELIVSIEEMLKLLP